MAIRVVCGQCQCAFQVADAASGKAGKCPKCSAAIKIPTVVVNPEFGYVQLDDEDDDIPYEVAESGRIAASGVRLQASKRKKAAAVELSEEDQITTATLTPRQILAAFGDQIEPVRPTASYRIWIVVVAILMILLPIIYIATIALTGWLSIVALGLDLFPMWVRLPITASGLILACFMLKPFFAKSGQGGNDLPLDPSKEPLLFAFVDGICQTVGSRTPTRIEVDCEINASARRVGGPLAVFNKDLVLTIGLPLIGGLTLRQFAGVLAHEFGHFSQNTGMRVSLMVRAISHWFARVVYTRDAWDDRITIWSMKGGAGAKLCQWIFMGFVFAYRGILWLFMRAGNALSGFLTRQMEFDADRYEARMSGGESFESTARRLHVLGAAYQGAYADLRNSWRDGSLVDNWPKLIVANVAQIPKDILEKIDEQVTEKTTGIFDTHPADRDRIFAAHAEDTDGVFHLDGAATDVFRDFDGLSRYATFELYRSMFGRHGVSKEQLKPVADVVRVQTAAMKGNEALTRFYQGVFSPYRPFLLPEALPKAPEDAKAAKAALVSARERMTATIEKYETTLDQFEELRLEAIKVAAATVLLKTDFRPKASEYGLTKSTLECAKEAMKEIGEDVERMDQVLSLRESATIRRIHGALSLLMNNDVATLVPKADEWRDEVTEVYPVARHMGRVVIPTLMKAVEAHQALVMVVDKWAAGHAGDERVRNAVLRAGRIVHEMLTELRWKLGESIPYPFDHQDGLISLARYALPAVPDAKDIDGLLHVGGMAIDKVIPMHYRLVGRLMLAAEAVETALRLKPLPERPKKDEGDEAAD